MSATLGEIKQIVLNGTSIDEADIKQDKALVKKAVHKHEAAMHPGKPLTKLRKGGMAC